jgi:HNH endonuclease
MRRVEAWIISRAFHENRHIAEVLAAYTHAGIRRTPRAWDSQLQLAAGKAAGFGGSDTSKRVSARTRAEGLVQLGWLERSGARGETVIRVTALGEQVVQALSGSQSEFARLTQSSRLNLKCFANSEELKGQAVVPSLTTRYVLEQLEERVGAADAYLTKDDLLYFLLWAWDDPLTTEGKRALKQVTRAIERAHETGSYPNPRVLPHHDRDAPRHFIANFERTGLFRKEGEKLFLLKRPTTGWEEVQDRARGERRPPRRQGRAERISVFFDAEHLAADISEPPKRVHGTVSRIVRNTIIIKQLKGRYEHSCQVCGAYIFVSGDKFYCEGHHLKPLGQPHNGLDSTSNVLILCPNHHAMFDLGAIAISPSDGRTLLYIDPIAEQKGRTLLVKHKIAEANIAYHYDHVWRGNT